MKCRRRFCFFPHPLPGFFPTLQSWERAPQRSAGENSSVNSALKHLFASIVILITRFSLEPEILSAALRHPRIRRGPAAAMPKITSNPPPPGAKIFSLPSSATLCPRRAEHRLHIVLQNGTVLRHHCSIYYTYNAVSKVWCFLASFWR